MKNNMIELIKKSALNNDFTDLNNIYTLYEQLQFSTSIKQMAQDIYVWLNNTFKIDNVNFSLFDIEKNTKETIFIQGEEFFLDDNLSFFFIINTHTNLNAIVSFSATSKVHFEIIEEKYDIIQASFFQISPIIQSGILKKNYIESSSIDSVTNVYNRKYFIKNLNKQLSLAGNKQNKITFLMIGIDHFKAVIDEFDYDIGDKVLINLAEILQKNVRESDLVVRLEADEFLIALVGITKQEDATIVAQKLIDAFAVKEVQVSESGYILKKTICVGITHRNDETKTVDDILRNADISLYEAKNLGRSKIKEFFPDKVDCVDLF